MATSGGRSAGRVKGRSIPSPPHHPVWVAHGETVAFKALSTVSNELVADSATNAQAAAVIGDGLVRQFARKIDLAFYGGTTTSVPTVAVSVYGLEHLAAAGTGAVVLSPGTFDSFDVFADAISQIESVGSVCTSFAASLATVNYLSKVKRFEPTATVVSNEPLLSQTPGDVANPVQRSIFGVPLFSVPEGIIPDGVVYAIASDLSTQPETMPSACEKTLEWLANGILQAERQPRMAQATQTNPLP
jgi:hypothetical protein